jgi:Ca2+-binding EF-hand superfamily protein
MKDKNARFAFRDQNQDGRIDHDEFVKTATAKDPAANKSRFKKLDLNHDGGITKEEFMSEAK